MKAIWCIIASIVVNISADEEPPLSLTCKEIFDDPTKVDRPPWIESVHQACFSGAPFVIHDGFQSICNKFTATVDDETVIYIASAVTSDLSTIKVLFYPPSPATKHPESITILTQLRDQDGAYVTCNDDNSKILNIAASQANSETGKFVPYNNFVSLKLPSTKDVDCYIDSSDKKHPSNITLVRQCEPEIKTGE